MAAELMQKASYIHRKLRYHRNEYQSLSYYGYSEFADEQRVIIRKLILELMPITEQIAACSIWDGDVAKVLSFYGITNEVLSTYCLAFIQSSVILG